MRSIIGLLTTALVMLLMLSFSIYKGMILNNRS